MKQTNAYFKQKYFSSKEAEKDMDDEITLHISAASGDVQTLKNLLQKDPSLLTRVSYTSPTKIPLHVATMQGHHEFVREILTHNDSKFARVLAGQPDIQKSSALHIASANGDVEMVKLLSAASPDSCFMRDCQGMNPLHLAAVKGRVSVLEYLIKIAPCAGREKVDGGLSLLHLCVKHNQLEALKALFQDLSWMINAPDADGNTVLHLAVRAGQFQTIEYLVKTTGADVNVENCKGEVAIDTLEPNSPDWEDIKKILKQPGSFEKNGPERWLTQKRDSIMVVAILIATMAFQAGVTPPGGVWQDDQRGNPIFPHRAGEAVIANIHPKSYKFFLRCNTVALVSSLSTILLLISGLPFKRKLFMWFLMVIMWLTITSIAGTYGISILVVTPKRDYKSLFHVMGIAVVVWAGVLATLLIGNTIRLIDSNFKKGKKLFRATQQAYSARMNQAASSGSNGQGKV